MEGSRSLLAVEETWISICCRVVDRVTHDLALVFLLLRLRRRTRFFLHFALILDHCGLLQQSQHSDNSLCTIITLGERLRIKEYVERWKRT
jgi:hypothetical protein